MDKLSLENITDLSKHLPIKKRTIIKYAGQELGALIPMSDLQFLEKIEAFSNPQEFLAILNDPENTLFNKVKQRLEEELQKKPTK